MKRTFLSILLISFGIVFFWSCEKEDQEPTNHTNNKTTAVFNPEISYGSMTDQEGNKYKTVTIGIQTWMAENSRTTIYNDGASITNITDPFEWWELESEAYCNNKNTMNIDTIATYGRLYNWYAVSTGKLAPLGWHVPTDAEWETLIEYLGEIGSAGGKLKEVDFLHWLSPNTGATNEAGFTALPSGYRKYDGKFVIISGKYGNWWSSSEDYANLAWGRVLSFEWDGVYRSNHAKTQGFSIRCVKD